VVRGDGARMLELARDDERAVMHDECGDAGNRPAVDTVAFGAERPPACTVPARDMAHEHASRQQEASTGDEIAVVPRERAHARAHACAGWTVHARCERTVERTPGEAIPARDRVHDFAARGSEVAGDHEIAVVDGARRDLAGHAGAELAI